METTVMGYIIQGFRGYTETMGYRDNGKESGNYYNGLYRDNIRVGTSYNLHILPLGTS